MPMLRLMAGGVIGGEAVVFAKNQIKELLSGKEISREEDFKDWERYLEDLAAVGSFGMMSDVMRVGKVRQAWGAIKFGVTPVVVADVEKLWQVVDQALRDMEKKSLAERANGRVSI